MSHENHEWSWEEYGYCFSTITTRYQIELYESAASHLKGRVCDFGAGSAKVASYLNQQVTYFAGIDASPAMQKAAMRLFRELNSSQVTFKFLCTTIEDYNPPCKFDSGLSLNSLYAWSDPKKQLGLIAECLHADAPFVLATPNDRLSMRALLDVAQRDLIAHPHFEKYAAMNMELAGNEAGYFPSLDELVELTREKFRLITAHQRFYDGGLSYLLLERR